MHLDENIPANPEGYGRRRKIRVRGGATSSIIRGCSNRVRALPVWSREEKDDDET